MKIAIVCPYDYSYPGGVIVHVSDVKKRLTEMGHQVKVLTVAPDGKVNDPDVLVLAKPISVPAASTTTHITFSLKLRDKVLKVFEEEKFDIAHLHEPFMLTLGPAVLRHTELPKVATFHASGGFPGYWLGQPIAHFILKYLNKRLTLRLAVSNTALKYVQRHLKSEFEILPNGIDLNRFSPQGDKIEWMNDGMFNILFVGRLERRKGIVYLLNAFARVKKELPNVRLVIAGPGVALKPRLKSIIASRKIKDVVFLGKVSDEDLPKYYRSADLFCAPATGRESFGIVLLEAMASGTPVVATAIDGYQNVITDGRNGVLARRKNDKDLAEKLISTIKNDRQLVTLRENGLQDVKQYSWEVVCSNLIKVYERAIEKYHKIATKNV